MTEDKDQKIRNLITSLSSDNDSTRKEARQSLVAIGSPAVPALIEALKQKDDHVRREAVRALCEIDDPELAPALIKTLEDEEFDIRWLALEGIGAAVKAPNAAFHALEMLKEAKII
jgi:HEAT repeat protein